MTDRQREEILDVASVQHEDPAGGVAVRDGESPAPSAADRTPGLRSAALSGIRATMASRFVMEAGGFASTLVIARLITPADLGRTSVALVIPLAASIFTYEGFASALVQRETVTTAHWRTSMALGSAIGGSLALLTFLFAVIFGTEVFDRETTWLVIITCPTFLLAGLSAASRARMQRELMLPALVGLETASFVASTVVSIALAAAGFGAYGLVIGVVCGNLVETFGGWWYVKPVRPAFDRECAKEIAAFGALASIAGIAYVFRRSGPYVVLAAATTPQTTGLFARAFQVSADNQSKLTGILLKISFPIMARASSLDETQRVRRRIVSSNAIVVLPLLAILSVTARDVIPALYGSQWIAAAEPAQALVLVGAAITLTSGSEAMSLARGRPGDVAVYNLVSLVAIVAGVWVAAPHGVMAVAWTCVVLYVLQVVLAQGYLIKRATGLPRRTLFADAGPATICSLIVWGIGWIIYPSIADATPGIVSVGIMMGIGLSIYVAAMWILWRAVFHDTIRQIRDLLRRRV